jgi:hypothetical protein
MMNHSLSGCCSLGKGNSREPSLHWPMAAVEVGVSLLISSCASHPPSAGGRGYFHSIDAGTLEWIQSYMWKWVNLMNFIDLDSIARIHRIEHRLRIAISRSRVLDGLLDSVFIRLIN